MKTFVVAILGFLNLFIGFAQGEEVIPRICWFDPPPELERLGERNDPGDNPFSMQSKAIVFSPNNVNPSNYQALNISLRTVGASIGNGKVVTLNPVSDAQLKEAIITATTDTRATNSPKVEETSLAGQKALKVHNIISIHEIDDIFWVRVRPNKVLEIRLIGATEPLLASVYQWLSSLKIRATDQPDPPPSIPLAQDETQLNLSKEEIIHRSGTVLDERGPDVILLTKDYQIIVSFLTQPNGMKGPTDMILYRKISDPPKAAAVIRGDPSISKKDVFLPLNNEDIEKLLSHHNSENKFTWRKVGNNLWRRSDGAAATLQSGMFFIASPEKLPDLSWFPK